MGTEIGDDMREAGTPKAPEGGGGAGDVWYWGQLMNDTGHGSDSRYGVGEDDNGGDNSGATVGEIEDAGKGEGGEEGSEEVEAYIVSLLECMATCDGHMLDSVRPFARSFVEGRAGGGDETEAAVSALQHSPHLLATSPLIAAANGGLAGGAFGPGFWMLDDDDDDDEEDDDDDGNTSVEGDGGGAGVDTGMGLMEVGGGNVDGDGTAGQRDAGAGKTTEANKTTLETTMETTTETTTETTAEKQENTMTETTETTTEAGGKTDKTTEESEQEGKGTERMAQAVALLMEGGDASAVIAERIFAYGSFIRQLRYMNLTPPPHMIPRMTGTVTSLATDTSADAAPSLTPSVPPSSSPDVAMKAAQDAVERVQKLFSNTYHKY